MPHRGLIALLALALLLGYMPCHCDMSGGSMSQTDCCVGLLGEDTAPDRDTSTGCQAGCAMIAVLDTPTAAQRGVERPHHPAEVVLRPGREFPPELHPPRVSIRPTV